MPRYGPWNQPADVTASRCVPAGTFLSQSDVPRVSPPDEWPDVEAQAMQGGPFGTINPALPGHMGSDISGRAAVDVGVLGECVVGQAQLDVDPSTLPRPDQVPSVWPPNALGYEIKPDDPFPGPFTAPFTISGDLLVSAITANTWPYHAAWLSLPVAQVGVWQTPSMLEGYALVWRTIDGTFAAPDFLSIAGNGMAWTTSDTTSEQAWVFALSPLINGETTPFATAQDATFECGTGAPQLTVTPVADFTPGYVRVTYTYRPRRYRWIFSNAPLRQFPRDDALVGTGGPRQIPRLGRSVQSTIRQGWQGNYRAHDFCQRCTGEWDESGPRACQHSRACRHR